MNIVSKFACNGSNVIFLGVLAIVVTLKKEPTDALVSKQPRNYTPQQIPDAHILLVLCDSQMYA